MPLCGNCGKSVDKNDTTCPHCGALLAAYASPAGSGETPQIDLTIHSEPTPIPSVEMDVPKPAESPVAADTEILTESASRAPQPLFNTNISAEELAQVADSDDVESVVTLDDRDVLTNAPESPETPTYARIPRDAEPIPIISTDTHPLDNRFGVTLGSPTASDTGRESWLHQPITTNTSSGKVRKAAKPPRRHRSSDPPGDTPATTQLQSTGSTEAYVRRLHKQAGYEAHKEMLTEPIAAPTDSAGRGTRPGGTTMLAVVIFLWIALIMTIASGHPNILLIAITLGVTWSRPGVRRFINRMRS